MNFTIDEEYLTDVRVRTEMSLLSDPENPTPDDLIRILKGNHVIVSQYSKDHDEFSKLRNQLEELGYISCQRNSWNGDIVLKPFTLNGYKFKKNVRFPCAAALGVSVKVAKKYGYKTLGL